MNDEVRKSKDPLREKSFSFAVRIVNLYKQLSGEKKEFVMSRQILKCGTNPGAMIREAANAESPLDFIHKGTSKNCLISRFVGICNLNLMEKRF